MAFVDMWRELATDLSMPAALARTFVNRALGMIYDTQMWSFQIQEGGWYTSGLFAGNGNLGASAGTITPVPFTNTFTADVVATAAMANHTGRPFLTEYQIRSPYYSLYNITAVDLSTSTAVITIDRPWMEPGGPQSYMMYQAYFSVPVADFKRFLDIRDTTNNWRMNYWDLGRKDLALIDPQRTQFSQPTHAIPFEVDRRQGSSTFGQMLYELWPNPLSSLPYTFRYLRRGPQLVLPTDTVPYPLNEELVLWRAKGVGYQWKESQRGEGLQRGSGANWNFLAGAAAEEYKSRLKTVKDLDRDLMPDLYFDRLGTEMNQDGYATINGGVNIGRM